MGSELLGGFACVPLCGGLGLVFKGPEVDVQNLEPFEVGDEASFEVIPVATCFW